MCYRKVVAVGISHELSSDVAAAILTAKEARSIDLNELKKTVLEVHFILQELTAECRRGRDGRRVPEYKDNDQRKAVQQG